MWDERRSARASRLAPPHRDLDALLEPRADGASADDALLRLCARVAPSEDALAEIARLGAELAPRDWERMAILARESGVQNLLFTHVARAGLLARIPDETLARMRRGYGEVAIASRRLELTLTRLLPLLKEAGAPAIVVKGLALSRRLYEHIALRPISDIDLLIHPNDGAVAAATLGKVGFTPIAGKSEPLSRHALRFREMQFQDAKGQVIEIHLNPCRFPAYQRAFAPGAIWAAAVPLPGALSAGLALAPYDELAFLCMHYAVQHSNQRMIWLTDVAEIARRIPDARAWDALVEDVIGRGVAAPVAVTLARARAWLDAPASKETLERLRAAALTRAERAAWDSAKREMSGLRWYLNQIGIVRTPLERAALLWSGAGALAGRARRRWRKARRDAPSKD